MLWYDQTEGKKLEEKIMEAADYFRTHYHEDPNSCKVHPDDIGTVTKVGDIEVEPYAAVLPGHIWLGIKPIPRSEFHPIGMQT